MAAMASPVDCSRKERRKRAFNKEAVVDCKRFGGANNSSPESCQGTSQTEENIRLCSTTHRDRFFSDGKITNRCGVSRNRTWRNICLN